eukprot:TRINITY_DN2720_c0_g2_i1.p1 TRINITY_DN2720_c0_g2~~TRINITY_DN2720_c0_g2_i1.p1  ORF type:complete len:497 (-),score=87.90 TRINITY_DN2720_c0_g2_i1:213-1703(-)
MLRKPGSKARHAPTLAQPTIAQIFSIMASLSLLPKSAWDLNKHMRREVRPAVKLRVCKKTNAALMRSILANKSVIHLFGDGGLPRVHGLPGVRSITLQHVQARLTLGSLPQHLETFRLVDVEISSSCLAACLTALPQCVRRLSFQGALLGDTLSMAGIVLPPWLDVLELQKIKGVTALPASLSSIALRWCWLPPTLQLPASLTSIRLEHVFRQRDASHVGADVAFMPALPQGLRKLELPTLDPLLPVAPLPPALADLSVRYNTTNYAAAGGAAVQPQPLAPLPESLKTLQIKDDDGFMCAVQPILGRLPRRLEVLDLAGCKYFNTPPGPLPRTLRVLRLGGGFTQILGPLPASLRVLDLQPCSHFDFPLGPLPPALQELRLGGAFNQPLLPLPPALKVLVLDYAFSQRLQRALPAALHTLEMGHRFDSPVELPGTLQRLIIGDSHTSRLDLAPGLKYLRIGLSYKHPVPPLPLACVHAPPSYPHAVVSRPSQMEEL